MLKLVHDSIRGRTRFKVAGLLRDNGLKEHLEGVLSRQSGISMVAASTVTGNLLVRYNPGMSKAHLHQLVKQTVEDFRLHQTCHPPTGKHSDAGFQPILDLKGGPRIRSRTQQIKSYPPRQVGKRLRPTLLGTTQKPPESTWHTHSIEAVLKNFNTNLPGGLSQEEVAKRLARYGPNALPPSELRSVWSILAEQFCSGPVAMLAIAAAVSVATGGLVDAVAIMTVVGINAVIGYVTETQSERTIHSLKNLVTPKVLVVRDGEIVEIDVKQLVPGDLMVLRPGHYVGADARIIQALRLNIDESALTGESMPVEKKADCLELETVSISERFNMCYMGTLVTGGQGTALATATGYATEMGTIQRLVSEAETPATPMSRQLDHMGNQLVYLSSAMCGAVFLVGLLRGEGLLPMIKTALALAVAAIPEGLPTVATTTLALGIKDMRKKGVLIRHLGAVEALGSTQVICLDKTGTITTNKMEVTKIHAGGSEIFCDRHQCLLEEKVPGGYFQSAVAALLSVMTLCNESEILMQNGGVIVNGTPTENALIHLAIKNNFNVPRLRESHPLWKIFHRAENHNYMMSLHEAPGGGHLVAVKGSPSEVLSLCKKYMMDGRPVELTEEKRLQIQKENEQMASESLRVLGAAYSLETKFFAAEDLADAPEINLIWLGLAGMADPIRDGVPELMHRFHEAGIKTVMITGDQSATAFTVGKTLALNGNNTLNIMDSSSLSTMEPAMLSSLSEQTNIFSRVSPTHKLKIVDAYQRSGKVVAMTGDGINDGPALKKADIGIAMGRSGTDVAREIADVVLEDDQLETMIIAIGQGRTIYLNVRKAVGYLLSTNFSEILVAFTANATGLGQPLNQMQLLWINMITDIFPGLALALEPAEEDILQRPPRNPEEPILRKQDLKKIGVEASIISLGALGAYGYGLARYGYGPRSSSLAFLSLTCGQLLHALHCRSEQHGIFESHALQQNKYLNLALGGSFALQLLALFSPPLRSLLGIQAIGLADAAVIGTGAMVPLLINDLVKVSKNSKDIRP